MSRFSGRLGDREDVQRKDGATRHGHNRLEDFAKGHRYALAVGNVLGFGQDNQGNDQQVIFIVQHAPRILTQACIACQMPNERMSVKDVSHTKLSGKVRRAARKSSSETITPAHTPRRDLNVRGEYGAPGAVA